ncbi:hypothetical protein [Eubacterium sp. 1001713B170207_170306_E7]|uniref:hypothetical protein n=1 Tax=Eubacterium sp. 1001713B170207_170306_E7 TaxID=2787097 RepID=UPI00189AE986|nr:hypothetical protein [Eubacterium sp. 1001713B170207_170306_E7]
MYTKVKLSNNDRLEAFNEEKIPQKFTLEQIKKQIVQNPSEFTKEAILNIIEIMYETKPRINENFKIIETIKINEDQELVLGKRVTSLYSKRENQTKDIVEYVTWEYAKDKGYFWGHYFWDEPYKARKDLYDRASEIIERLDLKLHKSDQIGESLNSETQNLLCNKYTDEER